MNERVGNGSSNAVLRSLEKQMNIKYPVIDKDVGTLLWNFLPINTVMPSNEYLHSKSPQFRG
jgi:hypothetical protein